jgi:hypothetical protein
MTPTASTPPVRTLRSTEAGPGTPTGGPVTDEAIRALGGAIHAELRESLAPEDIVRLATDLLGRVTAELQAARHAKT